MRSDTRVFKRVYSCLEWKNTKAVGSRVTFRMLAAYSTYLHKLYIFRLSDKILPWIYFKINHRKKKCKAKKLFSLHYFFYDSFRIYVWKNFFSKSRKVWNLWRCVLWSRAASGQKVMWYPVIRLSLKFGISAIVYLSLCL